jgi:hypothetical protein
VVGRYVPLVPRRQSPSLVTVVSGGRSKVRYMYEIHQPKWGADSHVGNEDDLPMAKIVAFEYGPKADVWRTYHLSIFGWQIRFTKLVWRSD